MKPSVPSRLWASGTAFVVGFVVANYGILRVPGRDQWLWLTVAVVLMLTGAIGVVVADSRRNVSLWAVLGLETLIAFTVLPLVWMFTLAASPPTLPVRSLLPQQVDWSVFGDVLGDDRVRHAAITSLLVSLIATFVSVALALPAAHTLVHRTVRARRAVYVFVLVVLLAPQIALAGPFGDQLRDLGLFDVRLVLALPTLVLTLPLALWLCVTLVRGLPWSLRDSVRADGATRLQMLRSFDLPYVAPGLSVVALVVLVAAATDALIGATLAATDDTRTLPATLLLASGRLEEPGSVVATAGLLWLVPALLVLLAFPRRIIGLLGRTYS